ncbi:MAG: DUF3971 domain-containing protein [Paracoccaceae bacterium]
MSAAGNSKNAGNPPTGGRAGHVGAWASLGLAILAVVVALVGLGLSGRSVPLPGFAVSMIESRANRALDGRARLLIGGGDLVVSPGFVPQIRLADVILTAPGGRQLARVSDLRTALDGQALMHGQILPARLTVRGAHIAVRRATDGSLDVAPAAKGFSGTTQSPAQILDAVDRTFSLPALSSLHEISVEGLSVLLDDRRSHQVWTLADGQMQLVQTAQSLTADVGFALGGQTAANLRAADAPVGAAASDGMAHATLHLVTDKASSAAEATLEVAGMPARDLALQVPAIAWLAVVDAPISGRFDSSLAADGALGPMSARIALGQGAVRPTRDIRPVPFDGAELELTYDPARSELALKRLAVRSAALNGTVAGKAWLRDTASGLPRQLVGQVALDDLGAGAGGLFASAVSVGRGTLDFQLDLDPFRLDIGQFALLDQGNRIRGKALISAGEQGWSVALDAGADRIGTDRVLALWPVGAVPHTRDWLAQNVTAGTLSDVRAALRITPGEKPRFGLDFRFADAEVRFLRSMPPVTGGAGYGSIAGNRFTLVAEKGTVTAPEGGDLAVGGTVVRVPDITKFPARLEVDLRTDGPVPASLSILDQPPLRLLSKAGQPTDLAEGRAEVVTHLALPLVKGLLPKDVDYQATAMLSQVSSTKLVHNRTLAADRLALEATPAGMTITGDATLDGVPVNGTWSQKFGPENAGHSRVEGTVQMSPQALTTFGIALPQGAVAGQGRGRMAIDLVRGQPPAFRLESDLTGLTLSIPEVGWKKDAAKPGSLLVQGTLGAPATVDRLELAGEGLSAKGKVVLKADNSLDHADFAGATLKDWFKGDLTLTGRGKGKPVALTITGGTADIRRASFGPSNPANASDAPIRIALDKLTITDTLSLSKFRGNFTSTGGFQGEFAGLLNGDAAITGALAPAANGHSAFRIRSEDAGQVLAAAGLYASGRGGGLDLLLVPRKAAGTYDGTLSIRNIRVVHAPVLAGLLDAVSVVGLIQQLQGEGIVFSDVSGQFLLTPDAVEIQQGSAVGASLGVWAAGVYRTADKTLDLQGVISPVYLVNGIGQIFSHQRDGLFGFNYTLKGPKDGPRVAVNPLSILTPGMFRDLFRKAPPTIAGTPSEAPAP